MTTRRVVLAAFAASLAFGTAAEAQDWKVK